MFVRVGDRRHEGEAVTVTGVDPDRLARAVTGESDAPADSTTPVTVTAPTPGEVVRRVSPVTDDTALSVGPAVVAAARSRGLSAPQDESLAAVQKELSALDPPAVDTRPARRRLATLGDREQRLQERVAELRGRLAARRETGEVPTELRERLQTAVTELTEARTERLAAQQRLDRAERRARAARDERERRLRLTDRRDNLRRAVREHFLARLDDELHAAARAVPGPDPGPAATFDPRSLGDTTAALAVLRVATVSAPVVLACDRFERARAAATCLAAPVIRVE